jgi:ribosome-associated heat shock protein Hsp15
MFDSTVSGARIKTGDHIDLVKERLPYSLTVLAIPDRRGPAIEARACYEEQDEIVREREQLTAALRQDRMLMPKTDGRPDKHTRRKLRERSRR